MKGALQIAGLQAAYGADPVLRGVDLEVRAGQLLAVIGPNGCGKSTLLRCIAGLVRPLAGRISLGNEPLPNEPRARARQVALLPQHFIAGGELTLEAMTLLGRTPHLGPYGAPSAADLAAVEAAIALVAPDLRGRRLEQLSGGERQRALLCRAVATKSPVLLLDEPVASLDIRYQHEVLGIVRRLARERQLAVVCVLHGINLAAAVADGMLLLHQGRVVAAGTPEQVMTESNLSEVYGLPLRIGAHPLSGRPQAQALWDFEAEGGAIIS